MNKASILEVRKQSLQMKAIFSHFYVYTEADD